MAVWLYGLKSGSSQFATQKEIQLVPEAVEVERYTLDGRRVNGPVPGVNIVRYSDGSVLKVMVK